MPLITRIENIDSRSLHPAEVDWQRREYDSPDGDWTLVLHSSSEWHMGATGWLASLVHAGKDVSRRHKGILRMAGPKGFQAPDVLQPWSSDGHIVALVTWEKENPVYLYDVESRSHRRVQSNTAFLYSVQFGADSDRVLLSFSDSVTVYDRHGARRFSVSRQMADSEPPFVSWLAGSRFLWIGRDRTDSSTVVRVYSGLDGTLLETEPLEPENAVPYDRHRYENLSREGLALRLGPGTWSVGSLLDRWHQIRVDRSSGRLFLSVFRPVSLPYQVGQRFVCDVEERWVAATLVPS